MAYGFNKSAPGCSVAGPKSAGKRAIFAGPNLKSLTIAGSAGMRTMVGSLPTKVARR